MKSKHKLERSWSGANSSYARGRCSCGNWHYAGWTTKMRDVIDSHKTHIEREIKQLSTLRNGNFYVASIIDADNEEHKANMILIAKSVNEYEALCKVSECAEKLNEALKWNDDRAIEPSNELANALQQLSTLRNGK